MRTVGDVVHAQDLPWYAMVCREIWSVALTSNIFSCLCFFFSFFFFFVVVGIEVCCHVGGHTLTSRSMEKERSETFLVGIWWHGMVWSKGQSETRLKHGWKVPAEGCQGKQGMPYLTKCRPCRHNTPKAGVEPKCVGPLIITTEESCTTRLAGDCSQWSLVKILSVSCRWWWFSTFRFATEVW